MSAVYRQLRMADSRILIVLPITGDEKSSHRKSSTATEPDSTLSKKSSGPDSATIRSNVRKSLLDVLRERSVYLTTASYYSHLPFGCLTYVL